MVLFASELLIEGSASGDASVRDNFGPVNIGLNEVATINTATNSKVTGIEGFAGALWNTNDYFHFESDTNSDVTINVIFDIS